MFSFSFILLFSLSLLFGHRLSLAHNDSLNASKTVFDVGVVLDLATPLGKMSQICISMAVADFYKTHNNYTTKLNLHWTDSNQDLVEAASKALDLLKDVQVKAIIGPQTSLQATFLAELGDKYHVPILSFSSTSPLLSSIQTPYFMRTALNDSSQMKAIAAVVKAFAWREVVQICEDTPYGNGVTPYLTDALQEVGARVSYKSVISHLMSDDQIAQELNKLKTMQKSRVFIVHLSLSRWKRRLLNENPDFRRLKLNIFGLWAYDAVWALAKAIEEVQQRRQNSIDLAGLGVSEIGPRLRDAILKTNFKGLSGQFNLFNGQLEASTFQIVNVNEKGEREIGFWTASQGLHKKLKTNSTSKADLKPIIWPGETATVPKSWKKLKIGVPKRYGFTEFVNVIRDPQTDQLIVTGYAIDIFEAAVKELPYGLDYEFVPFENEDGKQTGNYNELVDQVYLKKFDAVVGDVTIIANRSRYVDFTLPYVESGVAMVVSVKENRNKAWIFLKPLCWDVWLTTGAAFVLTGVVVWTLEHRINEEFRGPLAHQVGVTLWFSFSTLVFAHRERLVSNWSRFVVIIWVFVVWILTTSYSASFTSLVTLQQLQPAFNEVSKRDYVGYQGGGFVLDYLKTLGYEESKLKAYSSAEEYAEALSNGTVVAIFDEIPYLRLFFANKENCAKYKMVDPVYKTSGFGFVFPTGSPLVADMSRAILNVTQGPTIKEIELKWRMPETIYCQDQPLPISSSLTLDNFWGLFLLTGTASISAFLIFLLSFLYRNKHVLITRDYGVSFHQRLIAIIRCFNERELPHRTTKPNEGLAIGNGHANNSTHNIELSDPNAKEGATVVITEFDTHPQHIDRYPCV
ncbi:glutamate receptor 2.2-like protein isoform X1 [Cinnamomum micranthum f. kanehirae]|uniref:Glutamate receptor n=1 Tax=Cinnamomum micranthum f. kanehirae TaxID=337451 RepID=A0A443NAC5_9MAGN|nr:glutamate receptor 2.2-like protein isoform X1 [Cinnamomum micranthum f. kanehirae]